jgi:SAM-dependent methyltransferase
MGTAVTAGDLYTGGAYLEQNPDWHVGDSAWKASQVLKMLDRHALRPSTVAEVGCGAGEILRVLRDRMAPDVRFSGYDISPDAIRFAATRAADRLEFHQRDMLEVPDVLDVVLAMDVIEHVRDVYGFLEKLRPRGVYKVFHVPLDINAVSAVGPTLMHGRKAMGHIHYFTRATALATLADAGYEVIDWFYTFGIDSPGQTPKTLYERAKRVARRTVKLVSHEWMVRLVGGASVLVLAK